eukprot:PhF_6_TR42190/c0_g1_i2/m.63840
MSEHHLSHIFTSFRILNSSQLRLVYRALYCLHIATCDIIEWFPYFPFLVDTIHNCWTEYISPCMTRCLILETDHTASNPERVFWDRGGPPLITESFLDQWLPARGKIEHIQQDPCCDYCAVKSDIRSVDRLLQRGLYEAIQYRVPRGDTVIASAWGTDQCT